MFGAELWAYINNNIMTYGQRKRKNAMLYTLWALDAAEQDKLDMFGRRAQQIALRRQCPNSITNEELATRTQMPPLSHIWSQQAIIYAGHIARMLHEC